MGFRTSTPAPNAGYNRTTDWPTKGGAGMPLGSSLTSQIVPSASDWHPTVLWMLGFVIVEMIVFHLLSGFLKL